MVITKQSRDLQQRKTSGRGEQYLGMAAPWQTFLSEFQHSSSGTAIHHQQIVQLTVYRLYIVHFLIYIYMDTVCN